MWHIRSVALAALVAMGGPVSARGEAPPAPAPSAQPESAPERSSTDAAYRDAIDRCHAIWRKRPPLGSVKEAACIRAWQEGERAERLLGEVKPPARFRAYDTAVRKCIAASQATFDECLVEPGGGPAWREYLREARALCLAVGTLVRREKLDLPSRW